MKYKIVETNYPSSLELIVNNLIKEGWKPVGGVSLGPIEGKYIQTQKLLQVMVKE